MPPPMRWPLAIRWSRTRGRDRRAALCAVASLCALAAPAARADIWQIDPGIGGLGDIDAVLEWQGRPHLGGLVRDRDGEDHVFVIRHEAGGGFTELLPQDQSPFGAPTVLHAHAGQLLAGGAFRLFDAPSGEVLRALVAWSGERWKPLGDRNVAWEGPEPGAPAHVRCLLSRPGELYAGGSFAGVDDVPGTRNVAVWRDGAWHALGQGLPRLVRCLFWHDDRLWAGSVGIINDPDSVSLWSWDGAQWTPAARYADLAGVAAIVEHAGALVIGGLDLGAGIAPLRRRTAAGTWEPYTTWRSGIAQILDLAVYRGDLVAGGVWAPAEGMPVNKVARWDGQRWRGLDLEFAPPGGIESLDVSGPRLWLAGDVFYDERIGLALWVDRSPLAAPAAAQRGAGNLTWTFRWSAALPADPRSHRLGLTIDGQPLVLGGGDPGVRATVTPAPGGQWSHEVSVDGLPCRAVKTVTWTAEFTHYGCRQKSTVQTWHPRPCLDAAAAGPLQVAPNPFNPVTTVSFALAADGPVRLEIVDLRGRRVRTLIDGWRPAGTVTATWDGRDRAGRSVAAGRYLARLVAGGVARTATLVLVQ